MSSVSSSSALDRGTSQEELKQMREEYEKLESDTAKKKAKEVHNLTEKYEKDLNDLRQQFDNQVSTVREKSNDIISERDKKHTEDVNKVRDLYLDSFKRKVNDDDRDRIATKESYEGQLKKNREISEGQQSENLRNFENSLKERDRADEALSQHSITKMQDGLENNTKLLDEAHRRELGSVNEEREREIGDLQRSISQMKAAEHDEKLLQDRNRRRDVDLQKVTFENVLGNQQKSSEMELEDREKILQAETSHLRANNDDRTAEANQRSEELREQLAAQIESRTGAGMTQAKMDSAEARHEQVMSAVNARRLRDLERTHLQHDFQERENDLVHQREGASEAANEEAQKKIDRVLGGSSRMVSEENRERRSEQEIDNMRNREAISNLEIQDGDRLDAANKNGDNRVRKILKATTQAEEQELRQHQGNLDQLRDSYSNTVQDQRKANYEAMSTLYKRMDQRVRDLDANWMKKHDEMVENYEDKLSELEATRKAELQRTTQVFEARAKQTDKAVKMEEGAIVQKYEQKLSMQEDAHRKDIERLERRHQEQMQAMAARSTAAALSERKA